MLGLSLSLFRQSYRSSVGSSTASTGLEWWKAIHATGAPERMPPPIGDASRWFVTRRSDVGLGRRLTPDEIPAKGDEHPRVESVREARALDLSIWPSTIRHNGHDAKQGTSGNRSGHDAGSCGSSSSRRPRGIRRPRA